MSVPHKALQSASPSLAWIKLSVVGKYIPISLTSASKIKEEV